MIDYFAIGRGIKIINNCLFKLEKQADQSPLFQFENLSVKNANYTQVERLSSYPQNQGSWFCYSGLCGMSADTGYAVIRLRRIKLGNSNGFQIFKIGNPQKQSIQTNYGICQKLKRSVWVTLF